jgi:hypothetical protein
MDEYWSGLYQFNFDAQVGDRLNFEEAGSGGSLATNRW